MSLDFVRLADLLRRDSSDPFKELVEAVRLRFPGRGHAFDDFIKQLKPLATGFLTVPDLDDSGRSARIRYWLNEAAQGRGQNFKPVLLRWFWKADEIWMRDFLDRWRQKLRWTAQDFAFPSDNDISDVAAGESDVYIVHFEDVDPSPLQAIANLLNYNSISASLLKVASRHNAILERINLIGRDCITLLYNSDFDHSALKGGGIMEALDSYYKRRDYLAKKCRNVIVLNQSLGGNAPLSADKRIAPYLELPVGAPTIALTLQQAVMKLRAGEGPFYQYSESLRSKNAGQRFLERDLERKAASNAGSCLTLFDIDRTNQINRIYGEDVGDQVITVTEAILSQALTRYSSDVGRCGDDTFFVAIYDGFNREGDMRRLNQEIATFSWDDVAIGLKVTSSAGYSGRKPNEAASDIVVRAALGLKSARENGGNQLKPGPDRIPNATSRYIRNHFS